MMINRLQFIIKHYDKLFIVYYDKPFIVYDDKPFIAQDGKQLIVYDDKPFIVYRFSCECLRPGGYFIGTTPNSYEMMLVMY